MTFKSLLDDWAASEPPQKTKKAYSIPLAVEDAARVEALAELFPGIGEERIVSDLLAAALRQIEAEMPYEQGDKIIREDEFGDPVFEDTGLTPRFRKLVRARLKSAQA